MADEFDAWLQTYKPEDEFLPVNVGGVQNPENVAEIARAKAYGQNQGNIDTGQAQVQRLQDTKFKKILNDFIGSSGATLDDAEKAAQLQKLINDSPQSAAKFINELLTPAMEKYNKESPAYPFPINEAAGFMREHVMPEGMRPDSTVYKKLKKFMKVKMARGLLLNLGQLNKMEQKDPQAILPGDYDTPAIRDDLMSIFKKIISQSGGE